MNLQATLAMLTDILHRVLYNAKTRVKHAVSIACSGIEELPKLFEKEFVPLH